MKQTGSALYLTDTMYCYNGYLYLIQCEAEWKTCAHHTDGSARETIADCCQYKRSSISCLS